VASGSKTRSQAMLANLTAAALWHLTFRAQTIQC